MTIKDIKHFVKANSAVFLILAIVPVTVYFNSLFNGFVSADDLVGYVNNPNLLTAEFLRDFFSPWWLIMAFFKATVGNQPFFLHLYSLILHLLCVFLTYTFSRMVFGRKIALYASLIFSVHPAISEAVLWMSGHGYLHLGIITLVCLNLYAIYKKYKDQKYLNWLYIYFALSVISSRYAWLLIIPFIITILEVFIYEKKLSAKSIKPLAPLLLIGLTSFILIFYGLQQKRLWYLENVYNSFDDGSTPWLNRLPYSFFMLFRLLIIPDKLALFHEGYVIPQSQYLIMTLSLLAFTPFILFLKNKNRTAAGLILLIVFSVLPIFSPIQIAFFIAERYMYVSAMFYSIFLAMILFKISKVVKWKEASQVGIILVLIIFGIRTFVRTNDWRSSRTLWESNSKLSPQSARIFNNLGDAYANEKRFDESIASFQRAIEIKPHYVEAIHNLGNTYLQVGQYELAKIQFEKALQLNPQYAGAERAKQVISAIDSMKTSEVSQ